MPKTRLNISIDYDLADPEFPHALKEVHTRIKDGSAQWHTFDEVFSD